MSELKDIEKERAIFAYEKVEEAIEYVKTTKAELEDAIARSDKGAEKEAKEKQIKLSEYKSYCKKIPSMIQANGLSATFAFMFSKSTGTYIFIYRQVEEWLNLNIEYLNTNAESNELMKELIKLDSAQYREVTIKILALFAWLRRFAEGKIAKEK